MKPLADITDPTVVKALGHPLRRRILGALDGRVASPSELAGEFEEQIGTVSYHFRALLKASLIELVSTEQRRGALEHKYRARCVPYIPGDVFANLPEPVRRNFMRTWFEKIGAEVVAGTETGGFDLPSSQSMRAGLVLDAQATEQLGGKIEALYAEALRLQDEAYGRIDEGAKAQAMTVVLMLFGTGGESADPAQTDRERSSRS